MSQAGWPPSNNPYESPKPVKEEDSSFSGGPWRMDYFGGFEVIRRNPNWFWNCFIVGLVFLLIPIIGQLVVIGYYFEVAELLHRTNGRVYWDFNFSRFGDYLARGAGPFLIAFLFGILLGVGGIGIQTVVGQQFEVPMGLGPLLNPQAANKPFQEDDMLRFFQAHGVALLIQNSLQFLLAFLYFPTGIRGGLSREFGTCFNFAQGLDFVSRTWFEMTCFFLFFGFVTLIGLLIGYATCCIGLFPVLGFTSVLNGWFVYQLYRLYLSRGGKPVVLKPLPGMQP
jgi:hypothetical protein